MTRSKEIEIKRERDSRMPKSNAKKYRFTGETKKVKNITVHQIQLVRSLDSHGLEAGTIGGWIESEHSLSEFGDCWVFQEAMILNRSRVSGNISIMGKSMIDEDSIVGGNGFIKDSHLRHSDIEGQAIEVEHSKLTDIKRDHSSGHAFRVSHSTIQNLEALDSKLFEVESSTIIGMPHSDIYLTSSFQVTSSTLHVHTGYFMSSTIINNTEIMNLKSIQVQTPLTMNSVKFTGETKIETLTKYYAPPTPLQMNYIGRMIGLDDSYEGQIVLGENVDLIMELARIQGEVYLRGAWDIANSEIRDYVNLENHKQEERTFIKDSKVQDLIAIHVVHNDFAIQNEFISGDTRISV